MITLTRLNGQPLLVNAMQLESVEAGADTRVTLTGGRTLFVRESPASIAAAVTAWFQAVFHGDRAERTADPLTGNG